MPGGRPSEYTPKIMERAVLSITRYGVIINDLPKVLGVAEDTLMRWRKAHPEFDEAIKKARDDWDTGHVEETLLRRALGFTRQEVKIFHHKGEPVIVPYEAYYPPDVASLIFWLKNRQPDRWKERQEVTGSAGGPISFVMNIGQKMSVLTCNSEDVIGQVEGKDGQNS